MPYNEFRFLPTQISELETFINNEDCPDYSSIGSVLRIEGNPLISPPPEVIAQGTEAILDYLRNQAWWHLQRLLISIASGVGLLAALFLGLRYRQRRNRKPKQKRDEIG